MDESIQPTDPIEETETPVVTDTPAPEEAPEVEATPEVVEDTVVEDTYHDSDGGVVKDNYLVQ